MEIPANILGQVLAELQLTQKQSHSGAERKKTSSLSEMEENLLAMARKRLDKIRDPASKSQIESHLVEYRCQTDQPFLEGNLDFFLALLFLSSGETQFGYCQQFFKHLNACYQCFEIFSEVMRHYYIRLQEGNPGETQS
jgi:hypothetical protein